ncbi:PadR family transcriptional regulator [Arthrobacter sp. N199823]|uniref:PadR family transcriptional regulator n=1 Tax=Arthrobacter sp. N199823 TaxID=2058895 RepID=UPI000CE4B390|nr:PadR family transcriptional regulator [Arthrobacter sp. N199823]
MNDSLLPPEWLRGVLPTCALAILASGSAHGYYVVQQLQLAGIGPIKGGALYPVLARLEHDGLLTSKWQEGEGGPGRKVYSITAAGGEQLNEFQHHWEPFAMRIRDVLIPQSGPQKNMVGQPKNSRTGAPQ